MINKVCDKCGVVLGEAAPPAENETTMPDLIVYLDGEPVLEFKDLCEDCKVRVRTNTEKYLAVKTRKRTAKCQPEAPSA